MHIHNQWNTSPSTIINRYSKVIKEGTREGYRDFQAQLKKPEYTGARKGDARRELKQLESCLRLRFDRYLVPLFEAVGLTFRPTQPNLFIGPETGRDYRIIVFAEKKAGGHPWAVCLVSKVVVLDSLEKLAGLAVAKALRGEEGLERLECSEIQKEIVGGLLDRPEKMPDWEIEMHREPDCGTEEEEEDINEEEKVSVGVTSGGEKSIGTLENLDPESEERNMAASKESTVLSSSEEEDDEKLDYMKTYDEDSICKDSTGKGSQSRKTENEERKMAPSINNELIPVM